MPGSRGTMQLSLVYGQLNQAVHDGLSQRDLLRLLESLRLADGLELVRSVAERMFQELIES
ncbi:hypothetical protein ACFWPU_19475 [Streptomyces sp. NPDC058471]|uniref:hypothetical protein n=1 Tax=Streptomyces sp. NPDC058471 TaxID=3346516 RepID=UPI00365BD7DC